MCLQGGPHIVYTRMWRHVQLGHSLLHFVFIASLCCVVYAQSGTCPEGCNGTRYWWTTMWGFIVTLVVLTLDVWGSVNSDKESTTQSVFSMLFFSALNPLFIVWLMLHEALKGIAMRSNLREVLGNDMVAPLWPWSKSHIKIIVGSNVVVNLSPDVYEEVRNSSAFEEEAIDSNLPEALVIGLEVKDSSQYNARLSNWGELALLRANILPPYDQLKFLRGSTNLGMTIATAQAVGYIYGVVVRCGQGLQVSPIEAIACVLNIVVLMKVVLHNFASVGHRTHLLYLLLEQKAKFIEECKKTISYQFGTEKRYKVGVSIKYVSLLAVGAYFIFKSTKSLNSICVASITVFYVTLVLGGILGLTLNDDYKHQMTFVQLLLIITIVLFNIVGYVLALIVTFKYWKAEEFDVQSSNYLSQVLPYIG